MHVGPRPDKKDSDVEEEDDEEDEGSQDEGEETQEEDLSQDEEDDEGSQASQEVGCLDYAVIIVTVTSHHPHHLSFSSSGG